MSESPLRLAIIEDNAELKELMTQYLSEMGTFEIVATASEGEQGLRVIRANQVDAAIIDLVLPNKDGLYILEELRREPKTKPICIVLSGISMDEITAKAFEKGADYYIVKPFDMNILARRIQEIWAQKQTAAASGQSWDSAATSILPVFPSARDNAEAFIQRLLHGLPVPNSLRGYAFIKTAFFLIVEDMRLLEGVTKTLYPAVAKLHKAGGKQVERAIRHAIEAAWKRGGGKNFAIMTGYSAPCVQKPTNIAFFTAIVELYMQAYDSDQL